MTSEAEACQTCEKEWMWDWTKKMQAESGLVLRPASEDGIP